ncbi:MAG: Aspartyl-tRNA(Asn) amidotransferase subunit [Labilithrix sp.]|nr:Aspartyl-tRNA(Asn) amidotransferase subunit [Labilithrix sp.]
MDPDRTRIRHVATLAELALTGEEEARFAGELESILVFFAELDAIDTEGVPPTAHVAGAAPATSGEGWRADEVAPCLPHEEALANAPRAAHDGFAVPTFVD